MENKRDPRAEAKAAYEEAKESDLYPARWPATVKKFIAAISSKHEKAGDHFVSRIIMNFKTHMNTDIRIALIELTLLATNKNHVAVFCLGRLYAGEKINGRLIPELDEKDPLARAAKAVEYLETAVALGDDRARAFLSEAFRDGKGCIAADKDSWYAFNKKFAQLGNQACAFDYAAATMGYFADKKSEGITYFLLATRGSDFMVTQKALEKLCQNVKEDELISTLDKEARSGNQTIALYLALCYCPSECRTKLATAKQIPEKLLQMTTAEKTDPLRKAEEYLSLASRGKNERVTASAHMVREIQAQLSASSLSTPRSDSSPSLTDRSSGSR